MTYYYTRNTKQPITCKKSRIMMLTGRRRVPAPLAVLLTMRCKSVVLQMAHVQTPRFWLIPLPVEEMFAAVPTLFCQGLPSMSGQDKMGRQHSHVLVFGQNLKYQAFVTKMSHSVRLKAFASQQALVSVPETKFWITALDRRDVALIIVWFGHRVLKHLTILANVRTRPMLFMAIRFM